MAPRSAACSPAPFTTPGSGGGSDEPEAKRRQSASTMQRLQEEKERINRLRAATREDALPQPPALTHNFSEGHDSTVSNERPVTRIQVDKATTTQPRAPPQQHVPPLLAPPQPDLAGRAGGAGFGSCTLACATASLGCGLLAFAELMDGHALQALAIMVLALACVFAAHFSRQLGARSQQHDIDAVGLL